MHKSMLTFTKFDFVTYTYFCLVKNRDKNDIRSLRGGGWEMLGGELHHRLRTSFHETEHIPMLVLAKILTILQ